MARLKSYSKYIFRLAACNDVGISAFSQPSSAVTTLPTGKFTALLILIFFCLLCLNML